MLKTRIIPTLLCRGRELIKGKRFDSWRRVGNTLQAARVHNMRQVDELCILNVTGDIFAVEDLEAITHDTFMPVTVGGGVRDLLDFHLLMNAGADKVAINTIAVESPPLVYRAARKYGSQAVVVSIDVKDGVVWTHNGQSPTTWDPVAFAKQVEGDGAGEILLNSIDRDGTLEGYDTDLIERVVGAVKIPVIASGGCGTYADMALALRAGAHAVAAGAMFLFTDQTPQGAALWLHEQGFHTRVAA